MCRCGGIIKGVLTSQKAHDAYVKSLNRSIDLQKDNTDFVIIDIEKDGKLKTPDIGDEGPTFPHNIYRFTVDPESFCTMLGQLLLKIIHENKF